MNYVIEGIKEAFELLLSFDKELYSIITLSLIVSGIATIISSVIAIPGAVLLGLKKFRGEKIVSRILYTFMSIPSVLVGLLVAIILSRRGPLGVLNLMYSPVALIIAQTCLVIPLIFGLTYNLTKIRGKKLEKLGKTLGAGKKDRIILILKELKMYLIINIVVGFSRAISEVGAVMIVGGNIKNHTRVITTSIAMFNSMGDYSLAIGLGIILLLLSFVVNSIVHYFREMSLMP